MSIIWLVRTVESKTYLREYNVIGVRRYMYSCNSTWRYIGKLNTRNKIMSLKWSNNWEPNMFEKKYQHTILSLLALPAVGAQELEWICHSSVFCISFPRLAQWLVSSFLWPSRPQCPSFPSTWGAGCCKTLTLTPYVYFHPRSQGPFIRL